MWRGIWPGDPPCERYTAAGWGGISCPLSSQRHTRTHMKRKTEKMREKKATLNAKHINLASQNPGRQELKVPFAHQLTHAKHMESAPHLILTKKKKSCYTLKWNIRLLQGAGKANVGTLTAPTCPFPDFRPAILSPLPARLQHSRLLLSLSCMCSLCEPRYPAFPPSHEKMSLVPRPPPCPSPLCSRSTRNPALLQSPCVPSLFLLHLCTCLSLCLEYSSPRSLPGSHVLPSGCAQATHVKMPLLFSSQN